RPGFPSLMRAGDSRFHRPHRSIHPAKRLSGYTPALYGEQISSLPKEPTQRLFSLYQGFPYLFLPFVLIILFMRKYSSDVDLLSIIVNGGDQSGLVAADIEYG